MSELVLYPRLPSRAARQRLAEVAGKDARTLSALTSFAHPESLFAATGGSRVTEVVLQQLRDRLIARATALGFPSTCRQEVLLSFDPEAGAILLSHLPIQPGEASRDEVWSFLTLVVLPDLATWRFPDQNDRRLLGGVRNAFQRLWWRAYVLRDAENADPWWLLRLPEDALVGLMERPGISSNPAVSRLIARGIAEVAALPSNVREDAWRDAYKRIRQRFPLVNLDVLSPEEASVQILNVCRNTITAFRNRS